MKFIPGPDFPTGGKVIGIDAIKDAYRTGRGIIQMQAKAVIEKVTAKKQGIVVTELPYLVGPERVIEKIADGVKNQKIDGISNVVDLTDRKNGLKIVIEVKNGFNPAAVLGRLYKLTPLQESFGINNVALVEGTPKTLGLKEMLEVWVNHRINVIRRQTQFRLNAKKDRLHLVEGLLIAILDVDEVIQVIRSSDDSNEANQKLQKVFDLDEIQAGYILDLRLRRLTKFSRIELENEKAELLAEIDRLEAILSSKERLNEEVCSQMYEAVKLYGNERRTVLVDSDGSMATTDLSNNIAISKGAITSDIFNQTPSKNGVDPLEIPDTPCYVLQSATGLVARCVRCNK
jgi:DNA gyrase subunit A